MTYSSASQTICGLVFLNAQFMWTDIFVKYNKKELLEKLNFKNPPNIMPCGLLFFIIIIICYCVLLYYLITLSNCYKSS